MTVPAFHWISRTSPGTPVEIMRDINLLGKRVEDVLGRQKESVRSTTANYAMRSSDRLILVDATGGARTVTLAAADGVKGNTVSIKKIDASANAVTIDGFASETIEGAATIALAAQWNSRTLYCTGTSWVILSAT